LLGKGEFIDCVCHPIAWGSGDGDEKRSRTEYSRREFKAIYESQNKEGEGENRLTGGCKALLGGEDAVFGTGATNHT